MLVEGAGVGEVVEAPALVEKTVPPNGFAALGVDEVPDGVVLPAGSPGAITFGLSAVRNVGEGLVELQSPDPA